MSLSTPGEGPPPAPLNYYWRRFTRKFPFFFYFLFNQKINTGAGKSTNVFLYVYAQKSLTLKKFIKQNLERPRTQRNDNFIDKTFTVVADILLKVLPTSQREKQAFSYYRNGMSAQAEGEYAEALQNYYEAMRLEIDAYDRSYILYNIGLIHTSNGEHGRALEYYYQALERNPSLPGALNNIAVIYHYRGEQAIENGQSEISLILFEKAADYWKEAIRLAPTNYIEAQNWLKMTGRNKGVESLND